MTRWQVGRCGQVAACKCKYSLNIIAPLFPAAPSPGPGPGQAPGPAHFLPSPRRQHKRSEIVNNHITSCGMGTWERHTATTTARVMYIDIICVSLNILITPPRQYRYFFKCHLVYLTNYVVFEILYLNICYTLTSNRDVDQGRMLS